MWGGVASRTHDAASCVRAACRKSAAFYAGAKVLAVVAQPGAQVRTVVGRPGGQGPGSGRSATLSQVFDTRVE
jgi:hypothetical protein